MGSAPSGARAPMSALSIAVVLSVQSLYASESLAWTATAVIASALLMEIFRAPATATPGAIRISGT
jgi:hypothetical protein